MENNWKATKEELDRERLTYAALVGYYLGTIRDDCDLIHIMVEIRDIAEAYNFKPDEDGYIDTNAVYEDAYKDAEKVGLGKISYE